MFCIIKSTEMWSPSIILVGLWKVGDVEVQLLMNIKQSHMSSIQQCLQCFFASYRSYKTTTHCLSQLWPIHCHHNSIVWGWRRLTIPVGHLVKHRGHLDSPVLGQNSSTNIITRCIICDQGWHDRDILQQVVHLLIGARLVGFFQHQPSVALRAAELLAPQPSPSEGRSLLCHHKSAGRRLSTVHEYYLDICVCVCTLFTVFYDSVEVLGDPGGSAVFDLAGHEVDGRPRRRAHGRQLHMNGICVAGHPGKEANRGGEKRTNHATIIKGRAMFLNWFEKHVV